MDITVDIKNHSVKVDVISSVVDGLHGKNLSWDDFYIRGQLVRIKILWIMPHIEQVNVEYQNTGNESTVTIKSTMDLQFEYLFVSEIVRNIIRVLEVHYDKHVPSSLENFQDILGIILFGFDNADVEAKCYQSWMEEYLTNYQKEN